MNSQAASVVLLLSIVGAPEVASADKVGPKAPWRHRATRAPEPAAPEPPSAPAPAADERETSAADPIPPGSCRCNIPGAFRHGGYFQRLALGAGYASVWGDGPSGKASISGLGASLSLYVGGTPWEGLVIGGTFGVTAMSGWFHGAASEGDGSAALPLLALFVDWYPAVQGAWHLGASFGLGGYGATDVAEAQYAGAAAAGSLFAGGDWWIGPQHSCGLMLSGSLSAPKSARDEDQYTGHRFMAASIGIATTLVYH